MKKQVLSTILIGLSAFSSYAQLVAPEAKPVRPITDALMVIQFGGQKLEVLPSIRATRKNSGPYSIVNTEPLEVISNEKLGVAYSYAVASNVLFNGEISIKFKPGYALSSLGGVGTSFKLLVSPDIYVMTVTTPADLVKWVNLLQAQPSIQWVEPFTIKARFN